MRQHTRSDLHVFYPPLFFFLLLGSDIEIKKTSIAQTFRNRYVKNDQCHVTFHLTRHGLKLSWIIKWLKKGVLLSLTSTADTARLCKKLPEHSIVVKRFVWLQDPCVLFNCFCCRLVKIFQNCQYYV